MKKKKAALPANATEIILESISDGVFTVDHEWRITSFNRAAEEITGTPRREAIGRYCWEVFRSNMCEGGCVLRRTMKEGTTHVSTSTYIINSEKRRVPISVSTAPLKNEQGDILGGVETFRDNTVIEELRRELRSSFQQGDMVSRSPLMKKIFTVLPRIAESDSTVLIEGETGTGKEILARALHDLSSRRDKPFVAINCGALPDTLLESELFGYKAGAFTGADKDKPGRFAAAEGGTLFLDEIGDITPALQVRLLRVLQEHIYEPLGSNTPVRTNVRVITAGNKNLAELVEAGSFRRDLYYRINVVRLELPPLRKRKEDVPLLVEHFIARFNRVQNRDIQGVTSAAMAVLMAHDYPGNIRELENIIEHAFVLCAANKDIDIPCLPDYLARRAHPDTGPVPIGDARKALEAQLILETLERNHGNRQAAARELGMHKSTLFRKMRALHLPYARPANLPKKSQ